MNPNQSEKITELAQALALAQAQMGAALKSSENPHFRSRYADLASVMDACRPALTANGISVIQRCRNSAEGVEVETMLLHKSGEWISDTCWLPAPQQKTPQAYGSAITYARRYGLSTLAGVVADDDDGNAASVVAPQRREMPRQVQPVGEVEERQEAAPEAGSGDVLVPFGKLKGQPLSSVETRGLAWYRTQAEKELADPEKARFHASTAHWLSAVVAEIERRKTA